MLERLATRLVLSAAIAGCNFTRAESSSGQVDAPPNATDGSRPIDAVPIDGCVSFSTLLDTCAAGAGADLTLSSSAKLDTESGALVTTDGTTEIVDAQPIAIGGVSVEVLVVHDLTLAPSVTLGATGARPFAIVASGSVTLQDNALIEVGDGGAGAPATCSVDIDGADNGGGGGGGGGGGAGAAGGGGGAGNSDGSPGAGGMPGPSFAFPLAPVGGCPGGHGGMGTDPGGVGGLGGGGIYIVAAESISIMGTTGGIDAGGAGGNGGMQSPGKYGDAGGGGGGAGGSIILESPVISSSGWLAANGGGGGEASGGDHIGNDGHNGELSMTAAPGGTGSGSSGTDGGAGGTRSNPGGTTVTATTPGGGGGGGGGVGFVVIKSANAQLGANVTPAATTL